MEKSFKKISDEFRKEIEEILKMTIIENFQKEMLEEKIVNIEVEYQKDIIRQLAIWNEICSERMNEIIAKIDVVRRVGGAYAMLISNPCLKSAIYAVYERLVDNFEDEKLYCQSAYFLVCAVMRMHSDEIWNIGVLYSSGHIL